MDRDPPGKKVIGKESKGGIDFFEIQIALTFYRSQLNELFNNR